MSVVDHVSGRGPHSVFSYYNAASPVVYWNLISQIQLEIKLN